MQGYLKEVHSLERQRKYRAEGHWNDRTLYELVREATDRVGDRVALVGHGMRMTYQELLLQADRCAEQLIRLGLKPSDVVSVQLPNWPEFVVLRLALSRIGAIINPIPVGYRQRELEYILGFAESRFVVVPTSFKGFDHVGMIEELRSGWPRLERIIAVGEDTFSGTLPYQELIRGWEQGTSSAPVMLPNPDDVALLMFTSGTESLPKGVMHTHNTSGFIAQSYTDMLGLTESDVFLLISPVTHALALFGGLDASMRLGAKAVMLDSWDPDVCLELIGTERCTYTATISTFLQDIVNHPRFAGYADHCMRLWGIGGLLPIEMLQQARQRLGFQLFKVYGLTESAPHAFVRPGDPEEKAFTRSGRAVEGFEIGIVDDDNRPLDPGSEGEEVSRGPGLFVGYLKRHDLTVAAVDNEGWFHSGDICLLDEDGYIEVVGRKKDMIRRAGQNFSPSDVEMILLEHSAIREVAIVAMPDERVGERACAFVVLRQGKELTLDGVREFLRERGVARFKWPERLEFIERLPMTPTGKIRKTELRDEVQRRLVLEKRA